MLRQHGATLRPAPAGQENCRLAFRRAMKALRQTGTRTTVMCNLATLSNQVPRQPSSVPLPHAVHPSITDLSAQLAAPCCSASTLSHHATETGTMKQAAVGSSRSPPGTAGCAGRAAAQSRPCRPRTPAAVQKKTINVLFMTGVVCRWGVRKARWEAAKWHT